MHMSTESGRLPRGSRRAQGGFIRTVLTALSVVLDGLAAGIADMIKASRLRMNALSIPVVRGWRPITPDLMISPQIKPGKLLLKQRYLP